MWSYLAIVCRGKSKSPETRSAYQQQNQNQPFLISQLSAVCHASSRALEASEFPVAPAELIVSVPCHAFYTSALPSAEHVGVCRGRWPVPSLFPACFRVATWRWKTTMMIHYLHPFK